MPCRCDGYEVTADDVRREMSEKVEHLEGQLCNAQLLIHKMLKHIDALQNDFNVESSHRLPGDLRKRAEDHIKVLLEHKKAEYRADVEALKRQLATEEMYADSAVQASQYHQDQRDKHLKKIRDLKQKIDQAVDLSDEDILG